MSKVPCGGFELGESLVMKDGKLDLAESGGSIIVDSELSDTSENPVQNKVVTAALDAKLDGFIVKFTMGDDGNIVSDKTFDEIFEAYKAGKKVSGLLVNGPDDWNIFHISAVNNDIIDFFMIVGTGVGINLEGRYAVVEIPRIGVNSFFMGSLTAGAS